MANTKNATIVTTGSVSPYKTTLDAEDGSIEDFVSNYKRAVDDGMCLDISNFIAKNGKHKT